MVKWDKPQILDVDESVYGPEDYLQSGAASRLKELGQWKAVHEIESNYGGEAGEQDPMEILIAQEEADG